MLFQPSVTVLQCLMTLANKYTVAKCGALDWQAKSNLIVVCMSKAIWHTQGQTK